MIMVTSKNSKRRPFLRVCFQSGAAIAILNLSGCVVLNQNASPERQSATGEITGRVVDSKGAGINGAEVDAFCIRNWTIAPFSNSFLVGSSQTKADGSFKIVTDERVDELVAFDNRTKGAWKEGALEHVAISGNVIHIDNK